MFFYWQGEKETYVSASLIRPGEVPCSPKSLRLSNDATFREGAKVEARFRGKAKFYPGVIRRVNRDGSYDIDYDDVWTFCVCVCAYGMMTFNFRARKRCSLLRSSFVPSMRQLIQPISPKTTKLTSSIKVLASPQVVQFVHGAPTSHCAIHRQGHKMVFRENQPNKS
jgi:hypothetical protein